MLQKNKKYKCGCGKTHAVDTAMIGAACRGRSIAHSGVGKDLFYCVILMQLLFVCERNI